MKVKRPMLLLFVPLYRAAIGVRNALFDRGVLRIMHAGVPTIAVGNVIAGGSGKTQVVEFLVQWLVENGRNPGVVSRGYGRSTKGMVVVSDGHGSVADSASGGDEPCMIARKFAGIPVVVAGRRIDAARRAVELGADCLVADDAFQHRALARDCNIVVCGDEVGSKREALLPAGDAREPLSALRRADLVFCSSAEEARVRTLLTRYSQAPVVFFDTIIESFVDPISGAVLDAQDARGMRIVLLTGIARSERVRESMKAIGVGVIHHFIHRDHHRFTAADLASVASKAKQEGGALVTTEKDWIRLAALPGVSEVCAETRLFVLRTRVHVRNGDGSVAEILRTALAHGHPMGS
jgi:tetraacyldisaccharide 4'-kinase